MQTVKSTNKAFTVLFLLAVLVTSCVRKGQKTALDVEKLNIQHCDFDYFKGKTKVHYESNDQSLNATVSIRIRQDSAIWMSVSVMAEAVRAVITKDSVYVYQKFPERDYKEYSIESLSEMVGVKLDYAMLEAVFLGQMMDVNKKEASVKQSADSYTISQKVDSYKIVSVIDKALGHVSSVRISDNEKINTATIDYFDYQDLDGCDVPQKITFQSESIVGDDSTVYHGAELKYSKGKFSSERISFPFNKKKYAE